MVVVIDLWHVINECGQLEMNEASITTAIYFWDKPEYICVCVWVYICVYLFACMFMYMYIVYVHLLFMYMYMYMYVYFFSRQKSAKVKTKYSTEYFAIDGDADIQMTGPVFRGATVFL